MDRIEVTGGLPNELLRISPDGEVRDTVAVPPSVGSCRAAPQRSRSSLDNGFEGAAVDAGESGYSLLVAQQLTWLYSTAPCQDRGDASGVSLSEIRPAPGGGWLLIERDNHSGAYASRSRISSTSRTAPWQTVASRGPRNDGWT